MPFVVTAPSSATQTFTLDALAQDAGNAPLELLSSNTKLFEFSCPAPSLEIQYAGSVDTEGSVPGSRKYGNRVITMKMWCLTRGALEQLQAKVAKIGREGGTLTWVSSTGETIVFDLLAHDEFEPMFDLVYHARGVAKVSVSFPAKPYGRGVEVSLSGHTEATLPALIFTEPGIAGDVPALGRLEITDNSAAGHVMVLWGLRSRNYSSAATAKLYYESTDAMWTLSGGAASAAVAGSSGGTVVSQSALTTGFVTQMTAAGLTHKGSYRVIARVGAPPNAGVVQMKFGWIYGTRAQYIDSSPVEVPDTFAGTLFYLVDLGQVSIPEPLPGRTMEWGMRIQATSSTAGDDLYVDYLLLIPADEGTGEIASSSFDLGASPVIEPSAKGEMRHDGFYRQKAAASTVWGDVPVEGDYLLIPPAGAEGRTLQVIVKPGAELTGSNRTDSAVINSITGTLSYTPRFLVVPDA